MIALVVVVCFVVLVPLGVFLLLRRDQKHQKNPTGYHKSLY